MKLSDTMVLAADDHGTCYHALADQIVTGHQEENRHKCFITMHSAIVSCVKYVIFYRIHIKVLFTKSYVATLLIR